MSAFQQPNWPEVVAVLRRAGWTQQKLEKEIGMSQGNISDLKNGKYKNPSYAYGTHLMALYYEALEQAKDRKAA